MNRNYIAQARQKRPVVPAEVSDYIVSAYVEQRQKQKSDEQEDRHFTHITPRTLLGILRTAQALARLRFDDYVIPGDVDEALRLMAVSKASLSENPTAEEDTTDNSKIYKIIRALAQGNGESFTPEWPMEVVRNRVFSKGFTEDQLMGKYCRFFGFDLSSISLH